MVVEHDTADARLLGRSGRLAGDHEHRLAAAGDGGDERVVARRAKLRRGPGAAVGIGGDGDVRRPAERGIAFDDGEGHGYAGDAVASAVDHGGAERPRQLTAERSDLVAAGVDDDQ